MYQRKIPPDVRCPLEYGMEIFGGKWKPRIICVLAAMGSLRYSMLRAELVDITDAVLSGTLKELARDGIVLRQSFDEIPPHVEYRLTDRGQSVVPLLQEICRWAGITRPEGAGYRLKQCQRCDYRK